MRDYPITIIEDAEDLHAVQSRVSALLVAAREAAVSARTHLARGDYLLAASAKDALVSAVADLDDVMEPLTLWAEKQAVEQAA